MLCPKCQNQETFVIDSRDEGRTIRRRRECSKCTHRFTTFEKVEVARLIVIKRDGRREAFSRDKVTNGIMKACEKRPVPSFRIEATAEKIEDILHARGRDEVSSQQIGQLVLSELKKLDKIAYIRFASVYKPFRDLASFEKEIRNILK